MSRCQDDEGKSMFLVISFCVQPLPLPLMFARHLERDRTRSFAQKLKAHSRKQTNLIFGWNCCATIAEFRLLF